LKSFIYYDSVKYRLRDSRKILNHIEKVIREYKKPTGNLSFIFVNDARIQEINKEFLKHNYFTDVIAFNLGDDGEINAEIYISVDTVKANANNYKVSLKSEILRVMIHGTLHICGFNDGSEEERDRMHEMEEYWMKKLV
jgi:probable rRNA maturation factor